MKIKYLLTSALLLFSVINIVGQTTKLGAHSGSGGDYNTFLGTYSGSVTIGNNNLFAGESSGRYNTLGADNVFLGNYSGLSNKTGVDNVFVGKESGYFNESGKGNVFLGKSSGYLNTKGSYNFFLGNSSGRNNTEGNYNVFLGDGSGYKNTFGSENLFIGNFSGFENVSGWDNVFIGKESGYNNQSGNGNLFIGKKSGYHNIQGDYNVCMGNESGYSNTTGTNNSLYGTGSGKSITTGRFNVYIGDYTGASNRTGSSNICIGSHAGQYETGSHKLYIQNSNAMTPLIYGDFATKQMGINTKEIPIGYAVAINGSVVAEEIRVALKADWPDFVFEKDYQLPSLVEVEGYIKKFGHLKNIPSKEEVHKNGGVLVGEIQTRLLQKIEELMLYTIVQEKELIRLKKEIQSKEALEKRLERLEKLVAN